MNILGISAFYHDSAACLVQDGVIVAAAQEERFTRKKGDASLPRHAMLYCLGEGGVGKDQIDAVVFYDKPLTKFVRLLTTYVHVAPRGLKSFLMAVPAWLRDKAWAPLHIERFLLQAGYGRPREFHFTEHHVSHAASAFLPSPFEQAAILTVDGVGEWATTAVGMGHGNEIDLLFEQRFPHSLGMLYSAFTYFTGFRVNSGEYKLMGLAPYGEPKFVDQIKDHLIEIREDGSFQLNMDYFGYLSGLQMTNRKFAKLFAGPPRAPEAKITRREMDLARSVQAVTEEVLLKLSRYARVVTGQRHLCLAGGVALNCVANGQILRSRIFDDIWIQPAAGDAGGAQGAALYYWHCCQRQPRSVHPGHDAVRGSQLGPAFSAAQIRSFLDQNEIPYEELDGQARDELIAKSINEQEVVGMFQGRMEYGPRALGNRSILADARSVKMQSHLNLATKFRESFRPFAPMVLQEDALDYFAETNDSPYMLLVDAVRADRCQPTEVDRNTSLETWVNQCRSDLPAITHVDYSARIQTIDHERAPRMHSILTKFKQLSGCSVIVNTSFNLRGEPIVCTPEEAFVCFMRAGIDLLVLENFVLHKRQQRPWPADDRWQEDFGLD
jgi:carbamoyltransferase